MKITLDIPDGILCGFFNGVRHTFSGLQMGWCPTRSIVTMCATETRSSCRENRRRTNETTDI